MGWTHSMHMALGVFQIITITYFNYFNGMGSLDEHMYGSLRPGCPHHDGGGGGASITLFIIQVILFIIRVIMISLSLFPPMICTDFRF